MLKYSRNFYSWKESNNFSAPCYHAGVTPRCLSLIEPPRIAVGPLRPPRRLVASCCIDRPLDVAAAAAIPPRVALDSKNASAAASSSYSAT